MIFLNSFTLLQMDGLQLTAVYDVFPRCKNVCKITTGKSFDELLQHDNKMRIWTRSGKNKIMFEWVTKHNSNANDDMYACVDTPQYERQ